MLSAHKQMVFIAGPRQAKTHLHSLVGWVEARNPTKKEGVRLKLRLKFGKMLFYEVRPEISPTIAQYNGTKGQYSLASINGPAHSRLLHSSTDQILAGSLHYATSYR